MPQALIVIFLLFFAILAYGWFYWQRAKARDAASSSAADPAADASASSDMATASSSTDQQ